MFPGSRFTLYPMRSTRGGSMSRSQARSAALSGTSSVLSPRDLVGLFVGHNFALKGLKPLLAGLAAHRSGIGRPTRSSSWSAAGGDAGPYRRLASRLGLADSVHFLGFYPDVNACYWSSDFFVQPTYYDPCSLVVLEALACGLPVITTAQNGASELMTDGREGYILTAADAQGELIAALDHMTVDDARRAMSVKPPGSAGNRRSMSTSRG